MKNVAATKGHRVSLADFFGKTEVRAAEPAIAELGVGTLTTANFYGCLRPLKCVCSQPLELWKLRRFRIRTLAASVKRKSAALHFFTKKFGRELLVRPSFLALPPATSF
jgi:hypothetical protein